MKFTIIPASLLVALASQLVGCAGIPSPAVGTTSAEVRDRWGAPTTVTRLTDREGGGERWAYSTGPEGRTVQILRFDASGRLASNAQGLTPERVAQVANGQTQSEVEALIGPSYWTLRYPFRQNELVHVYRYMDVMTPTCFYVGYDATGHVSSTGRADEDVPQRRMMIGRPC